MGPGVQDTGSRESSGATGDPAHRKARRVLLGGTALVLVLFAVSTAVEVLAGRAAALRAAQAQVDLLDQLLADRMRTIVQEIDSVLVQVVGFAGRAPAQADWDAVFAAAVAGLTNVNLLIHVDAGGTVRHASRPGLEGRKAIAGAVLEALAAGEKGLAINDRAILGPLSGARVIGFGRRLENPDGSYAGAVLAGLDLDGLEARTRALQVPAGARLRLLHEGGNEFLRVGHDGAAPDTEWIAARRRLDPHPVLVEFALDRARVLERWSPQLRLGTASSLLVALALLVAAAFSLRQLDRLQRESAARREGEARIARLANSDALTGLPNRTLLRDRVDQSIAQAGREGRHVALLFVDLDRFKLVNDSWGHPFGDALLTEVGRRLVGAVRAGDTVARLGGDEFAVLLPSMKRPHAAARVAQKILEALARPVQLEGRTVPLTGSVGISVFPADGDSMETLLQNADAAMYRAKDLGRGGFQFYQAEMGRVARDRVEMESSLHDALPRGELALHYQPQVALADGRICGFEALMRWRREGQGLVSPARFIPVAEESGLIVPLGEWALVEACRQAAAWRRAGLGRFRVSVNLSARQFWQDRVTSAVRAALDRTGADPTCLEVEITEGVVLRDVDQVTRSLGQLRDLGVTVAIDDFGTGYSSLAYLRALPIDKLKIDKSFLRGTPEDPDACALVAEIIQLAHVLKLEVVAEGVEQEGQAAFLRGAGCEHIQGFLFSPALPEEECERLLRDPRRLVVAEAA